MKQSYKKKKKTDLKWFGWNSGIDDCRSPKRKLHSACNGKPSLRQIHEH